jgi:hypothetical protein
VRSLDALPFLRYIGTNAALHCAAMTRIIPRPLAAATRETALRLVIQQGVGWVRFQQRKHRAATRPMNESEWLQLSRFFDMSTLSTVSVAILPELENPRVVSLLRRLGMRDTLDFSTAAGVTYGDIILISQSHEGDVPSISLLFHEMVHVVQYRVLGVRGFIERYVRGWAENGYAYLTIPLERDAYALQRRYDENPQQVFSVEAEVRRCLSQ